MKRPGAVEWADYAAGKVTAERRAELDALAERDDLAAAARSRALRTRDALGAIASMPPPELGWDHIGARVHWTLSLERRQPQRTPRHRPWVFVVPVLAMASALAVYLRIGHEPRHAEPSTGTASVAPVTPTPAASAGPRQLAGAVTHLQGSVLIHGAPVADLDRELRQGDRISTGDGSVVVQFEDGSAFALGPGSNLELRRFDDRGIELELAGRIDVDVRHRRPGQSFAVVAGGHRVEVRGTRFRVDDRDGQLDVVCTRGLVAVRTRLGRDYGVPAGARLRATGDADAEVRSLSDDDARGLDAELAVPLLPSTEGPAARPAVIAVAEPAGARVVIDGVELGAAPVQRRVSPGRHHVEAIRPGSRQGRARWVELSAGERLAVADLLPERPVASRRDVSRRRAAMVRAIEDAVAAGNCIRGLEKRGLARGAYLELELGVDATGSQHFLNVIDSDLPLDVRRCVRDSVDRIDPGAGAAFELRHRLVF